MITMAVLDNGDWDFNSYKENQEAIMQEIKTALQHWQGDAFWDIASGINWQDYIGMSNNDDIKLQNLQTDLAKTILSVYGVVLIQTFTLNIENKKIRLYYEVLLNNGEVISDSIN